MKTLAGLYLRLLKKLAQLGLSGMISKVASYLNFGTPSVRLPRDGQGFGGQREHSHSMVATEC